MNRNFLGTFLSLLILPGSLLAQTNEIKMPPPAPRRPSIILILADNIGYGDLGCYGQTKIKTPNLDRLAKDGVRFTSFYTASPDAATARASLFVGTEPRHLHAGFNEVLPPDAVTIAALLKERGYHTGLIGAWGLGETGSTMPDKKGFDDFAGFLNTDHAKNYYTDRLKRMPAPEGYGNMVEFPENEGGKHGRFMPDLLSEMAVNFVRINKPELLNKYRPFFLCLSYPIAHVSASLAPPGSSEYSDAPWPPLERIRATLISRMDAGIGQLLNKLDEMKISPNTMIVFTSLGGPQTQKTMVTNFFNSTGPLRGEQGTLSEGGLRVPMIIRGPAGTKSGVSDLPCAAWDLLPTAAEIAFLPAPEKLDGISLMPELFGETQTNRHEFLYWEKGANGFEQAVRMGDWKAVSQQSKRPSVFNLKNDPAEKQNIATNHADVTAKLEKILNSARKESGKP